MEQQGGERIPEQDMRSEPSAGQLLANITNDVQTLFRQEIQLAKAELREDAAQSARAAGMLATAGFAGHMVVVLLSLAAMFGLGTLLGLGWSALIVAGAWALIGGGLFAAGRSRLRAVSPMPERTIESLKEDAEWIRHPTR